jgi:hypothetical protein
MYTMRVTYCIPTCKANAAISLKILIPSMIDCGISVDDIIIVEGGHNQREQYVDNFGALHINTNHNSFDYTAIIEVVESNFNLNYIFNIHDTCRVGPKFKGIVDSANYTYDKIAAYHNNINGASMAMGLIKYSYLLKHKQLIQTFKNTDYSHEGLKKAKYNAVVIEDSLFWNLSDTVCGTFSRGTDRIEMGIQPTYKGLDRLVEYYEPLDLYKFKSNYGQSSDFTYNL